MNFDTGGQEVIHRLLDVYKVKTRQALCDILGASKSTMATRYMRDTFPADWVLQASIDTGANVEWIAFGTGNKFANENKIAEKIPSLILDDAEVRDGNRLFVDKELFPESLEEPCVLFAGNARYVMELGFKDIVDGLWLMDIDGKKSLREIMRLPQQKVRVTNESGAFECAIEDVRFVGFISLIMRKR